MTLKRGYVNSLPVSSAFFCYSRRPSHLCRSFSPKETHSMHGPAIAHHGSTQRTFLVTPRGYRLRLLGCYIRPLTKVWQRREEEESNLKTWKDKSEATPKLLKHMTKWQLRHKARQGRQRQKTKSGQAKTLRGINAAPRFGWPTFLSRIGTIITN
jgi:hypothetical protein